MKSVFGRHIASRIFMSSNSTDMIWYENRIKWNDIAVKKKNDSSRVWASFENLNWKFHFRLGQKAEAWDRGLVRLWRKHKNVMYLSLDSNFFKIISHHNWSIARMSNSWYILLTLYVSIFGVRKIWDICSCFDITVLTSQF